MISVSVCLITYNHEKYIAQALDSVLMQKTTFDYEIVIGEDRSTDQTKQIILEYKEKYPDRIKVLDRPVNLGLKKNFVDIIANCSGKYIAVLSGDDYWTDENKIQNQYNFLENNPEYILIGNNAYYDSHEFPLKDRKVINETKDSFEFDTRFLIVKNPCIASQVLFRNIIGTFPDVYYKSIGEDRRLYILLSLHGKCWFDTRITGGYRIHCDSVTQSRDSYNKKLDALVESIQNADNWNAYLGNLYTKEANHVKSQSAKKIVYLSIKNKNIIDTLRFAKHIDPTELDSTISGLIYKLFRILSICFYGQKTD